MHWQNRLQHRISVVRRKEGYCDQLPKQKSIGSLHSGILLLVWLCPTENLTQSYIFVAYLYLLASNSANGKKYLCHFQAC